MELLKFVSDVWRECILRVQAHTGVVLKVTSGPLGRGHGSQEGVEEVATLMVGEKTGFAWQKCSLRLRECGSDDRLGIRILPATLETMAGGSWEAVNLRTLGAWLESILAVRKGFIE